MNNVELKESEQANRNRLKAEKPRAYEKIIKYAEKSARGESIAMIDITWDYVCNLKCQHCSNLSFEKKDKVLTPEVLKDVMDQADEMGLAQLVISGGEPLLFKDLEDVFKAIEPERFHIAMSTNGLLLTPEKASYLKSLGLDKVKISVDSIDAELHESNRGKKGAHQKAIDALFNAKNAGLSATAQHCATHQSVKTENMEELAKFCQENGFGLDIIVARAIGKWEGNHDVLIDEEDAAHLRNLHQKYPALYRDVFPSYGLDRGCGTVKNILELTKYGDVLPCVFIHISLGNIFEEPLKDIIERGLNIKHFNDYNPKCLSGEDRCFIDNYMTKFYGKPLPVSWKEVFSDEDFIDPSRNR
jgi:MoaA/NifB/PqqE/SkfB family radical SAM enzyme